jgi:hypothetical protein
MHLALRRPLADSVSRRCSLLSANVSTRKCLLASRAIYVGESLQLTSENVPTLKETSKHLLSTDA